MKVFVIGATGYIGSNIARHLAAHGHQVTGFARNEAGADKIRSAGHQAYIGDIADLEGLCATACGGLGPVRSAPGLAVV